MTKCGLVGYGAYHPSSWFPMLKTLSKMALEDDFFSTAVVYLISKGFLGVSSDLAVNIKCNGYPWPMHF